MTQADQLRFRLDRLEAEPAILTIELRNTLLCAANDLLPDVRATRPGYFRPM